MVFHPGKGGPAGDESPTIFFQAQGENKQSGGKAAWQLLVLT